MMLKVFFTALAVFLLVPLVQAETPAGERCHVIKRVAIIHCQRGVERCQKCREMYAQKYCLLDICPRVPAARRVTEVMTGGGKEWREFDIVRQFDSYEDALAYGKRQGIEIIVDGKAQ